MIPLGIGSVKSTRWESCTNPLKIKYHKIHAGIYLLREITHPPEQQLLLAVESAFILSPSRSGKMHRWL